MPIKMKAGLTATLAACGAVALAGCETVSTARAFAHFERTLDAYAQTDTTVTDVTNARHADGRDAALVSAFFGLDNALPKRSANRVVCDGAGGEDGMPVIFSHEVDVQTLEPGDFRVTTASGAIGEITCLTLAPADDPGELRTALLAGDYGSLEDQPVTVEIVGNILSLDGSVNFKGAQIDVTPLEVGPTIVWAEMVPETEWTLGAKASSLAFGGGSSCPVGAQQVVRVTWGGGITKPGGEPADDVERALYKVTIVRDDATEVDITPFALADLNDGDNNHLLCLDTTAQVVSVFFPGGHVTDPREDLNPDTAITTLH